MTNHGLGRTSSGLSRERESGGLCLYASAAASSARVRDQYRLVSPKDSWIRFNMEPQVTITTDDGYQRRVPASMVATVQGPPTGVGYGTANPSHSAYADQPRGWHSGGQRGAYSPFDDARRSSREEEYHRQYGTPRQFDMRHASLFPELALNNGEYRDCKLIPHTTSGIPRVGRAGHSNRRPKIPEDAAHHGGPGQGHENKWARAKHRHNMQMHACA